MITINGNNVHTDSINYDDKTFHIGDEVAVVFDEKYKPLLRTPGINGYHCIIDHIDVKNNRLSLNVFDFDVTQFAPIDKIAYVVRWEDWMNDVREY